jgi:hypothetical protein
MKPRMGRRPAGAPPSVPKFLNTHVFVILPADLLASLVGRPGNKASLQEFIFRVRSGRFAPSSTLKINSFGNYFSELEKLLFVFYCPKGRLIGLVSSPFN